MNKLKVIDGGNIRDRWKGCFVLTSDYENLSASDYEQELFDLFEYNSFNFDENCHELDSNYA